METDHILEEMRGSALSVDEYAESNGILSLLSKEYDASTDQLYPPNLVDLVRLHRIVRFRHSSTVLEFGVGYSTLVIALALKQNEIERQSSRSDRSRYSSSPYTIYSVDSSRKWIEKTTSMIPQELKSRINILESDVEIGKYQDQICHYYARLPDIVPDFIYLDGPNPNSVRGSINGLSFSCKDRTVMAADILLMEPTFLPGLQILIDGRTNNARFLQRNLKRQYVFKRDVKGDVTLIQLDEDQLWA